MSVKKTSTYAVCIINNEYESELEQRKIYEVLPDKLAADDDLIRVIDESGEDYLFPSKWFVPITLPDKVRKAFRSKPQKHILKMS